MGAHVRAGDLDIWTEQVGRGPDVLLIAGAGDSVEVWQYQLDGLADRYRLTAFDNRGVGRTRMPEEPVTVEAMADDAAGVLDALGIPSAHVAGYSGGSVIAQELALRHPGRVRSLVLQSTWAAMDTYYRSWVRFVQWLVDVAPSPRAFLEGFYLDIYTPRAYEDGTVSALIDDVLAFPHQQSADDLKSFLDPLPGHDTTDRLPRITAPTLVLSGGADPGARPELGRVVAEAIPGALFEVQEGQSHQPFQEIPDAWNARVDAFWQDVEARSPNSRARGRLPRANGSGPASDREPRHRDWRREMGQHIRSGDLDIWTEQVGHGPDLLLIGGLGDTVESWQFQLDGLADRYRMTAFDNRGAGRTKMPDEPATVEAMADDAAAVLRGLDIPSAHVAGFSGGSIISQELALRHPDLVRSLVLQSTWGAMDTYMRTWVKLIRWLAGAAPSERDFLEGFFPIIYTARAHNDGTVAAIIDEALTFPYKQRPEDTQRTLDAFLVHRTIDRLDRITVPTLVLAGGLDPTARPPLGREVAARIRGAVFEVMEEESHQPFQEVPDQWNARVDAFWRDVESRAGSAPRPREALDRERLATDRTTA